MTGPRPLGVKRRIQYAGFPFTWPTLALVAPLTSVTRSMTRFPARWGASLNTISMENSELPSWPSGTFRNSTVSGLGPGPSIVSSIVDRSCLPLGVQRLAGSSHAPPASTRTLVSSLSPGTMVRSHWSVRPLTGLAFVTSPFSTLTTWSRMSVSDFVTGSLSATRISNAVSPSCVSGTSSNCARSGCGRSPQVNP